MVDTAFDDERAVRADAPHVLCLDKGARPPGSQVRDVQPAACACRERVAPADLKDRPIAETIRSVPVALGSPDPQPDMWRYDDSRSMPAASFRDGRASEETATGGMRVLTSILAPLDRIIPIRTYRTENESGVEIISLIRIGNKNPKNNP